MNRLIVVTGGTKGIGLAIMRKFAGQGFDIITCSRNQEELDQVANQTSAEFGVEVFARKADLSVKAEVQDFVDFIHSLDRPVDVLVNNTGVFLPGKLYSEEEGSLETMINTNLYSAYNLTRGLVKEMMAKKEGYIFNMCSIASLAPYPEGSSYSVSKFALLGFSRSLREEMKEFGIRVSSVLPGAVLTPSWDGVEIPPEKFIKPEDIAESIYGAYALSDRTVVEEILIRPQLGDF